jgi:hypothetical protein
MTLHPLIRKPNMGRPKTLLNIDRQPPVGSTWIIENVNTKELCRCSATSHSDKDHVEALRQFSGPNPFFTAKIGSKHTGIQYLKFFCGDHLELCIDVTLTWKWLNITRDEADIKGLWYSEPNLVTENPLDGEDVPELPETDFKSIDDLTNPNP